MVCGGYLPTAQAFGEGDYEPTTTPLTAGAEDHVIKTVIEFLQGRFPQPLLNEG